MKYIRQIFAIGRYLILFQYSTWRAMGTWNITPSPGQQLDEHVKLVLLPFIAKRYVREYLQMRGIRMQYPYRERDERWEIADQWYDSQRESAGP